MKNTMNIFPPLVALSILLVAGCANLFRANFVSTQNRLPNWISSRLAPISEIPKLQHSSDIMADNLDLFEKGYVMIGFSKFDGPTIETKLALKEALAVGADIVLLEKKYSKTLTETVTVTKWPADEITEIREDATFSGDKGTREVNRRMEIRTSKSPETTYVPKQVDYYQYSATYWRKLQRPVFGALVQDLSDEMRQKLQTNRGFVVRAVMVGSPAYLADLLKGDIILKIDGEPVSGAQKFYDDIVFKAGKDVELTILRREKTFKRRITLGS